MKESRKKGVLFFSDSSVLNPILHSQGLPLTRSLSENGFRCYFLSFESRQKSNDEHESYTEIVDQYAGIVSFHKALLKENKVFSFLFNYFSSGFIAARKIISQYKIDIIHTRSLYPAIIGLFLKIIYPKIKLIYDNRGVFIEEQIYLEQWKRGGVKEKIFKTLEKQVLKKSDHIVVVSKVFRDLLIRDHPKLKNLSDKVSVINNKTLIKDKIEEEDLTRRKTLNKIVGIYSGSSAKWQNINEIFSFAQKCSSEIKNFRFKVLTYESEKFKKLIANFGELSQASEISEVSPDDVFENLLSVNFGLLLRENNIVNNVSSPLKFAEYLSAGLPVVVSEGVGDTGEIIKRYNVGVIVINNDYETAVKELRELLNDPDIYLRCRDVSMQEYNMEDSLSSYLAIYQRI
jgi:glycosyltransferase involved in cell wall biosynthesis